MFLGQSIKLGNKEIKNRIAIAPMCVRHLPNQMDSLMNNN